MSWEIAAGVAVAVIGMFIAMARAGGDIRWGLTSGIAAALIVLGLLTWARSAGLM